MIVLKTKVRVDDEDDEVDDDEHDDDDDESQKRIRVDGGDDEVDHDEEGEGGRHRRSHSKKQFVSSATTMQVHHGDDDHCDVAIQSATSKTQSAPQPQREREFLNQPLDT